MVVRKLKELGYDYLTDIQTLAVENGLFKGSSLLVSAPTNTGKTFIGELAAISASKRLDAHRVFYLVPLKTLAEEKFLEFESKYHDWGLNTAITTADRTEFDEKLDDYDLIIATYEKLYALIVRDKSILKDIAVVIVDELQNLNDSTRGAGLEVLLTVLAHPGTQAHPQIIGLSATIPNPEEIATWLDAKLVSVKKRTVELREGIQYLGEKSFEFKGIEVKKGTFIFREHNTGKVLSGEERPLDTVSTFDELAKSEQVLIFAPMRITSERIASDISKGVDVGSNVSQWINELEGKVESTPSTKQLKACLTKGIAFHHAGLLSEERSIVERAFAAGDVKVVAATSTMGAGINTPAKTAIILPSKYLKVADYKNMAGRAGRIRYHDRYGRSVLFAQTPREMEILWSSFVEATPERVTTQIPKADLDLQLIGLETLLAFLRETFFGNVYYKFNVPEFRGAFDEEIRNRLKGLEKDGFLKHEDNRTVVTIFGKRVAWHILPPSAAIVLLNALNALIIKTEIQGKHDQLVEALINVGCMSYTQISDNLLKFSSSQEMRELRAYAEYNKENYLLEPNEESTWLRAIKTTQMLLRWIDGENYSELRKFAEQGTVKRIAQTVSWILNAMLDISKRPLFEFNKGVTKTIEEVADRLFYGVPSDCLTVAKLEVPGVGRGRAIRLANAGYISLDSILNADAKALSAVEDLPTGIATELVKVAENYIENVNIRVWKSQIRRATELGRDVEIINKLYTEKGDEFAVACAVALRDGMGINCTFIGDSSPHEADLLIDEGERLVVECKRKQKGLVSAEESEEILGKGKKHNPTAYITIGYPDFSQEARKNCVHTNISLLTHRKIGEVIVAYWDGKLNKQNCLELLKSGKYEGKEPPEISILDS